MVIIIIESINGKQFKVLTISAVEVYNLKEDVLSKSLKLGNSFKALIAT